ncbi:unnamed protein product [Meloidogyne enterolobii]
MSSADALLNGNEEEEEGEEKGGDGKREELLIGNKTLEYVSIIPIGQFPA